MSVVRPHPILEEIRRLHENEQSGVLTLSGTGEERVEIFFREGMIEAATSSGAKRRLGDYLVRLGHLETRDLDGAQLDAKREKILFGEAAVRRKLLAQGELGSMIRRQAVDLIEYAIKNNFCVESFATALRSYYAPARMTYHHVLLEMCRSAAEPLEPQPGVRIVLSSNSEFSTFPWLPRELSVLAELQVPRTFDELLKATGLQPVALKQILNVLDSLQLIETDFSPASLEGGEASLTKSSDFALEHFIPVVANPVLNEKLQVARAESSFASEQFKNLKIQIRQANSESPLKVITVSSPEAQDGKSLISANLAFSFAMDPGRRVIILDCDLRSPSLHKYLGVTSEPGLIQCLADGNLNPYCYLRRIENLYLMTAGGIASNPIEVLSMNKMKQLVERLKRDFDTVILDSPPYCPIADARIVTGLSDALIMVLRRGRTSYSSTDRAFKSVDRSKLLGVVFNDVQPMLFHTYHDFGHHYYSDKQPVSSSNEKTPKKQYLKS